MCCGRTWWSSGVWVGSCPDTWPACPVWQLMSPAPSGRIRDLLEKWDLQMHKWDTLKRLKYKSIIQPVSPPFNSAIIAESHFCLYWWRRVHICQSEPWSGPAADVEIAPRWAESPSVSRWGTWRNSPLSWWVCWSWRAQWGVTITSRLHVMLLLPITAHLPATWAPAR